MNPQTNHIGTLQRIYFTKETENAIIKYNESTDPEEREQIFLHYIYAPIDKLAENVINRFKFPYIDGSFDEVKAQVVAFLVMNLHKYTNNKGMAFSYFSVIAKNYLILNNNNAYRDEKRSVYMMDETNDHFAFEETLIVDTAPKETQGDSREFIDLMVVFWDINIDKLFKKQRDREIANAVVHLMRRIDHIDNFNKKAIYLMIREMTDQRTPHVTKVINKMKVLHEEKLQEFRKTGHIEIEARMLNSTKSLL